MENDTEKGADFVFLDRSMKLAGWSILIYGILPLSMQLCFFIWGPTNFTVDTLFVFVSVYVGIKLLLRSVTPVTFGFVSFLFIDAYYTQIILTSLTSEGKYFRFLYNYYWWDQRTLAIVCLIGLIWCLINTYLLWRIRSILSKSEFDEQFRSDWSSWDIAIPIILFFVIGFSVLLVLEETTFRRYFLQIPDQVTLSTIQERYAKPLNAVEKLIKNYSQHENEQFPIPHGDEEIHEKFSAPEILRVDLQSSPDHYRSIYRKRETHIEIYYSESSRRVGLQKPVLDQTSYEKNGTEMNVVLYKGAAEDQDGTIRTYIIYFDANMLSESIRDNA